jgi:hypothetical protein
MWVHPDCNESWSIQDEAAGDLFSIFNGRMSDNRESKPLIEGRTFRFRGSTEQYAGITGIQLHNFVWRCVRAFHAALYGLFLPDQTAKMLSLPFPSSVGPKFDTWEGVAPAHAEIAWKIHNQRIMSRCDQVCVYSGMCKYLCMWDRLDNGLACCFYAIKFHSWEMWIDQRLGPRAACVGAYIPREGLPKGAKLATRIEMVRPLEPFLDPFVADSD